MNDNTRNLHAGPDNEPDPTPVSPPQPGIDIEPQPPILTDIPGDPDRPETAPDPLIAPNTNG